MSIDAHHPLYDKFVPFWVKCRDTYAGEDAVKAKRTAYLPPTDGMIEDGMNLPTEVGYQRYDAYLKRAVFHDFMKEAVQNAIGAMHCKPATIKLPPEMEPLRTNATSTGESLDLFLRRINEQQLVTSRLGILGDLPTNPDPRNPLPYLALYEGETIINWDDGKRDESNRPRLNLVVLCETEDERQDDFDWEQVEKYRVLVLGDVQENESAEIKTVARVAVVRRDELTESGSKTGTEGPNSGGGDDSLDTADFRTPKYRGRTLDEIPFVFINSRDILADPDYPTLLGLANLALACYRGEADFRQNLYAQGQDTLVTVGSSEDDHRTGVGASINLKHGGEAYFIGVSADGLDAQFKTIAADKTEAAHRAGALIDNRARPFESGEALKTRQVGHSATLTEVAIAGAYGLQTILRTIARWIGADESQVEVIPNLDFQLSGLLTTELVELLTARTMGAPISLESVHTLMRERGMTRKTFEEEMQAIMKDEIPFGTGTETGGDEETSPPAGE